MKNLKYLQTVENEHLYQINEMVLSVNRIVASLYSPDDGETSICWFVQSGEAIAPVELWKNVNGIELWQALLDDSKQPQTEILINPVGGGDSFNDHPVIKTLSNLARNWGRSVPNGKMADQLHPLALAQALEYLESENQIDWQFHNGKTKAKELFRRGDINRPGTAALAQGIIYLMDKLSQKDDYIPGSLCSVRRDSNSSYTVRIGNRTFRPRSMYK